MKARIKKPVTRGFQMLLMAGGLLAAAPSARALYIHQDPRYGEDRYWRLTPNLSPNPIFLYADLDLSGVHLYGWGTLISPQHFITARHAAPGPGTVLAFRNRDGVIVNATVQSLTTVSGDICIGVLTEPIPESAHVSFYSVVSGIRTNADYSWHLDPSQRYVVGGNQGFAKTGGSLYIGGSYGSTRILGWTEQSAPIQPIARTDPFGVFHGLYDASNLTGGDSAKPLGLIFNNQYTIVGANWIRSAASFLPDHVAAVNAVMAAQGYQLTVISPFTPMRTATWVGGGEWSTNAVGWDTGTWRNGADAARFTLPGGAVTIPSGAMAHALVVTAGATNYHFSGGELQLTAGGLAVEESVAIDNPLTADIGQTWTVAAGKRLILNSRVNPRLSTVVLDGEGDVEINGELRDEQLDPVGAHGALIQDGSGTLTLNGTNACYVRPMSGITVMGHAEALRFGTLDVPAGDTGTVVFAVATNLTLGGLSGARDLSALSSNGLALAALTLGESDVNAQYEGDLDCLEAGGTLTKRGTGMQMLTGVNTFGGGTFLEAGSLGINRDANLGGTNTPIAFRGGVLRIDGMTLHNFGAHAVTIATNVVMALEIAAANHAFTLDDSFTCAGLRKSGAGTLQVTGDNDFGTGTITATGAGLLILTGSNTCSGGTFLTNASLAIASEVNVGGGDTPLRLEGGMLEVRGTALHTLDSHPGLWATFSGSVKVVEALNTFTIGQPIGGSGGLAKTGAGTLVLAAANTFTGNVDHHSGGVLRLDNPLALQNNTLWIANNGGAVLAFGGITNATVGGLVFTPMQGSTPTLTLENTAAEPVALSIGNNNAALDFSGILAGSGSLIKVGTNTSILSGSNTYTGRTEVAWGTLRLAAGGTLAPASAVTVSTNGAYEVVVAAGSSYAPRHLASQLAHGGALETPAAVIGGTNGSGVAQTVRMQWRPRKATEISMLASDVFTLEGLTGSLLVLNMNYRAAAVSGDEGDLRLMQFKNGNWRPAAGGAGVAVPEFLPRAFDPATDLHPGACGLDQAAQTVWAVLDAGGSFAVAPSPAMTGLLLTIRGDGVSPQARAAFVKTDTLTQGNWTNAYGTLGYVVVADAISLPSNATVSASGKTDWTWTGSTADVRALKRATSDDRVAACWFSTTTFTIDVDLLGRETRPLALYCVDWDLSGARAQTVEVLDAATATVLDSRTLSGFHGGVWLVWNVRGHVQIHVTNLGTGNAVVSGLFLGMQGEAQ